MQNSQNCDLLITGATGFIGRTVLREVSGARIVTLSRQQIEYPGIQSLSVSDWTPDAIVSAIEDLRPAVTLNLAAYGVTPGHRDEEIARRVNIDVPLALLSHTARSGGGFVSLGSCSEYSAPDGYERIPETAETESSDIYAATKTEFYAAGRRIAERSGTAFAHIRLFNVYGPGEAPHRLLPSLVSRLLAGQRVPLSPGQQTRDYSHVGDVAKSLLMVCDRLREQPDLCGVFNLCSGAPITVKDFAYTIADLMEQPRDLLGFGDLDYRATDLMHVVGDPDRFSSTFSPAYQRPLRDGLAEAVRDAVAQMAR